MKPLPAQQIQLEEDLIWSNIEQGGNISGKDLLNLKHFALIFVSSNCPYVDNYAVRFRELAQWVEAHELPIFLVNANSTRFDPEENLVNAKRKSLVWASALPYLLDEEQHLAKLLKVEKNPEAFILQRSGDGLRLLYRGAIDDLPFRSAKPQEAYLLDNLQEVINDNKPVWPSQKAIGCGLRLH